LYVSTDAGEPLGRLVGGELTGPYPSQVAEALAGILKERGKRLGVPSHDGFDTGLQAREQPLACALLDFGDLSLDRKSTRLNSSHVSISYAVFCLQKQ